jgi:hypothetical protein
MPFRALVDVLAFTAATILTTAAEDHLKRGLLAVAFVVADARERLPQAHEQEFAALAPPGQRTRINLEYSWQFCLKRTGCAATASDGLQTDRCCAAFPISRASGFAPLSARLGWCLAGAPDRSVPLRLQLTQSPFANAHPRAPQDNLHPTKCKRPSS